MVVVSSFLPRDGAKEHGIREDREHDRKRIDGSADSLDRQLAQELELLQPAENRYVSSLLCPTSEKLTDGGVALLST